MTDSGRRTRCELAATGWAMIDDVGFNELLLLCDGIEGRRRRVKRLLARPAAAARGPSLTESFGLGRFPPHTDGASEVQAPRYVALWSPAEYETATLLFDGEDPSLAKPIFSRAWLSGGPRKRFYVVPRRVDHGRVHWRLNLGCMRPIGDRSSLGSELACLEQMPSTRIEWHPNRALLFDNARVLHGREALVSGDENRELMRVSLFS